MGYWDIVAPDFQSFRDIVTPQLPPVVYVIGIPIPRDVLVIQAWTAPFSASGIALRAIYFGQIATSVTNAVANAWDAVNQAVLAAPGKSISLGPGVGMTQLIIPNVYRCAVEMLAGTKTIVNVLHVEGSSGGQQSAAAAAVLAGWKVAAGPLNQLSSLITMSQVTAMDLSTSNGGISTVTDSTAGGQSTNNSLATRGACALIKLNGGTRSRSTRGRIYYGPVMEFNVNSDGATLGATSITGFTTAFNNFMASISGAGFTLGVASRKNSTFTSASSVACETTIATQRRRIRT